MIVEREATLFRKGWVWRVVGRCVEIGVLVPAFGFLIPAIPSNTDQRYRLFPGLAFGAVFYAISLGLCVWRGGEHWVGAGIKLLLFCGLGWVIHVRVWDY